MDEKGPMDQNMTAATAEPGVDRSMWSIMAGVFTSPAQAFGDFNRRPKIAVVLIVTIIMGMIIGATTARYSAKMQYDLASRSTAIPAQALEQLQEKVEHPSPVLSALLGGAGQTIVAVIIALLAWGIGSFVMGGDSTFKKVWGATLLGGLIGQVGGLVKIPLMMAKDSIYVSFGLAALFPTKDFTSILYGVLFYLDAFAIWAMIVTGIGYAAVFNISQGKGISISVILSILGICVAIGGMLVGMSFMGVKISFF